ncbi:hypothetical protein EDC22_102159 [Tepidamorphus gemmatus]|uniref:Uncharacterized protein n=1 Tax=Tepidamorphus gemmatus TaxID=747076 RepID=A0A4R3MJ75_9HYPH|nr:prevent-host-death protein [Tepidamorphus gemmatus]TCT12474.1 hypothetical protein EDC22_102159 [Tepidamorphus gemmatus]
MRQTKPILAALILSTALAGPSLAQEARLTGTVAEIFGNQVVVTGPQGRTLVTLPDGAATPAVGTRVEFEGQANGQTFAASRLNLVTSPPPATAPARGLPSELAGLGLTEVTMRHEISRSGSQETHVHGRLGDGSWLRVKTRDGRLVEARTSGSALPPVVIDALLPPMLRGARELDDFARITEIDIKRRGEVEIEGVGRDELRLEIEFGPDGRLRDYERERAGRHRSISEEAARAELSRLGYDEVGVIKRGPRHVDAVARNPWGEWVDVRLDDRGRVERERALTR